MRTLRVYVEREGNVYTASSIGWGPEAKHSDIDLLEDVYMIGIGELKSNKRNSFPQYKDRDEFLRVLESERDTVINDLELVGITTFIRGKYTKPFNVEFHLIAEEDMRDYRAKLGKMRGYILPGKEPLSQRGAKAILDAIKEVHQKEKRKIRGRKKTIAIA